MTDLSSPATLTSPKKPPGCGTLAIVGLALLVACMIAATVNNYFRYPYGHSHSCDTGLHNLLRNYADQNGGAFPYGEATPEASLSLLARSPWNADAELLRGKSVPLAVVEPILAKGELLKPETCGWHYVEDLRANDDQRIALFWDKVGLGHNGERLTNGNRVITRIGFSHETIPGPEWADFLLEQRRLLEKLPEDRRRLAMREFPE